MLSIVTFAEGRRAALHRLLEGTARLRPRPFEVVVVDLGGPPIAPRPDVPVRIAEPDDRGTTSPAAARARGAELACGSMLLFLDADCIPGPDLVGEMRAALHRCSGLVMAEVRDLADDADLVVDLVDEDARRGAARPGAGAAARDDVPPHLFRPTAFGVRRRVLEELSPLASNQQGQDALGRAAAQAGVPISFWRSAVVYRQPARRRMAEA